MVMSWNEFTTWLKSLQQYWNPATLFDLVPADTWYFMWVYVGLTGLCLLIGILLPFLKKIRPSLKQRISQLVWTNFWLGLILFFFRYQRIPILGMDIWRTAQEICLFFWIIYLFRFSRTVIKKESVQEQIEERRNRYLPQPKRLS